MNTVHVNAGKPYDVLIENGLLQGIGAHALRVLGGPCTVAVLTDDAVDALYGAAAQTALEASGFRVCRYAMPHGEKNKNLTVWAGMLAFLAENHLTRTDCVLALGGGVVGDMAGFAAASYLRGVPLIQAPTTLLAMVDSSVGGKTGLNLPAGKNLAGAFYQPKLVVCDPATLATLPADTLADGMAEAVKYGVLGDAELFELLAKGGASADMPHVIERCVAAKAAFVAADERDTGSRQLLNLGHTLGHAIERCSNYGITHGHAVAVGMVYAARLSNKLGLCGADVPEQIAEALRANQLPTDAPYKADELLSVALSDKKRAGNTLTFVLPRAVGRCELHPVEVENLPKLITLALQK